MNQPNIVYVHSHDSGRHVAPYGYAMPTPSIQRLAEEGVLFRRAFSVAPTCSPSRAALLTGTYPHENGMLGLAHRGFGLTDYDQHLVATLRRSGYHTALAGLQHVAEDVDRIGYDQIARVESHQAVHVAPAAAALVSQGLPQPFFLDVGFSETHRPFPEPGPDDDPDYLAPPVPLPDTAEARADMAGYRESVRRLDTGIGSVLRALDDAGIAEQTLVICTTDHGLAFPQMKCNLTDHGIGVMLIMRGPGPFGGGEAVDAMVSHLDVFPTICEAAGIDPPGRLRGTSLAPLLRGEAESLHEEIFAEVTFHAAYEPQRCVRTDRWKYIRRFDQRDRRVLANCDAGPSRTLLERRGWAEQPRAEEMLYDLVFDPTESHNLVADARVGTELADLRGRLERWMVQTRDPLLDGPVQAPAGARIDEPDR